MFASSLFSLVLVLAAPPQSPEVPPTIALEALNAFVEAGNYHRIRIEKLGHVLEATGKVEFVAAQGGWPIVEFPGHLRAALQGLPKDHGLAVGDRVRFRGLIVDEGYACLQVWTYDVETLPPVAKEEAGDAVHDEAGSAKTDAAPAPEATANRDLGPGPAESEPAAPSRASLAKSSEDSLPKITIDDLDAAEKSGEYLRVRQAMIGHRLYADAVVEKVGAWPLVRLSDRWHAHLHSHSSDWRLKEGDRVRFHGLIVDEAYSAVTVWVERIEKLPVEAAPAR